MQSRRWYDLFFLTGALPGKGNRTISTYCANSKSVKSQRQFQRGRYFPASSFRGRIFPSFKPGNEFFVHIQFGGRRSAQDKLVRAILFDVENSVPLGGKRICQGRFAGPVHGNSSVPFDRHWGPCPRVTFKVGYAHSLY